MLASQNKSARIKFAQPGGVLRPELVNRREEILEKMMKKLTSLICALFVCSILMVGCGPKADTPAPGTDAPASSEPAMPGEDAPAEDAPAEDAPAEDAAPESGSAEN